MSLSSVDPGQAGLYMGESSKFPKSWTLEDKNLKLAVCLQIIKIPSLMVK